MTSLWTALLIEAQPGGPPPWSGWAILPDSPLTFLVITIAALATLSFLLSRI